MKANRNKIETIKSVGVSSSVGSSNDEYDSSVAALINQVATRVLTVRKSKRLSRRELSELSGVSPRYLVRLEAGEGNISIGLLQRIAVALERPIEWFVSSEPQQLRERKAERICLIGLRGAGKSTLGSGVARELDLPFIELNQEIECSAGMPVAEVIAMYGDEGYRRLEADTLKEIVAKQERFVLAVAGGVVEQAKTYADVLERFHTVWLQADPADHMERVHAQGDLRPMAGNPQAMDQLRDILKTRESRYSQAEHHINTSGKTVDASIAELIALVHSFQILSPNNN